MNSFVGRSQDVVVINGRRRKIIIVTITCVACIIVAIGRAYTLCLTLPNGKT